MTKTIKNRPLLWMLLCLVVICVLRLSSEKGIVNQQMLQASMEDLDSNATLSVVVEAAKASWLEKSSDNHSGNHSYDDYRKKAWRDWFDPLHSWHPTLAASNSSTASDQNVPQVLFYHVMKAGGSSLYRMFYRMSLKYNQDVNQCGWTNECCGVETPGKLPLFVKHWRHNDDKPPQQKLLAMAFREPIERTISHYFQVKPCPDGSGGGADKRCTHFAASGILPFLEKCHFARSFQSKYLDNDFQKLEQIDVILRNDRIEESLVLMSIQHRIPIMDLIYIRDKVRLSGAKAQKVLNSATVGVGGGHRARLLQEREKRYSGNVRQQQGFSLPKQRIQKSYVPGLTPKKVRSRNTCKRLEDQFRPQKGKKKPRPKPRQSLVAKKPRQKPRQSPADKKHEQKVRQSHVHKNGRHSDDYKKHKSHAANQEYKKHRLKRLKRMVSRIEEQIQKLERDREKWIQLLGEDQYKTKLDGLISQLQNEKDYLQSLQ